MPFWDFSDLGEKIMVFIVTCQLFYCILAAHV